MSKSEIEVFVGVDMAKGEHYAQAITTQGARCGIVRPAGR